MTPERDLNVRGLYARVDGAWQSIGAEGLLFTAPDGCQLEVAFYGPEGSTYLRLRALPPGGDTAAAPMLCVQPGGGNVASVSAALRGQAGPAPVSVPDGTTLEAHYVGAEGAAAEPALGEAFYLSFGKECGMGLEPRPVASGAPTGWAVGLRAGGEMTEEDVERYRETGELKSASLWLVSEAADAMLVGTTRARWSRGFNTLADMLAEAEACTVDACDCTGFEGVSEASMRKAATCTCGHPVLAHIAPPPAER
ncbi:MAG: hypothetical protein P1V36_17255 [Planctomycetota bacterium]|nr:hypothetical protein [Planctomycetota bacterium]